MDDVVLACFLLCVARMIQNPHLLLLAAPLGCQLGEFSVLESFLSGIYKLRPEPGRVKSNEARASPKVPHPRIPLALDRYLVQKVKRV